MRLVFFLILLAGLGLAGFAVYTAQGRFSQYQAALSDTQQQIVPTVEVIVAARQLGYGDALAPEDVASVAWPKASVPEGAFVAMADVFPEGADGPRTVLRIVEAGEPLLPVKLTAPGEAAGIAASLTPGMRAFTLQVDVASGVSGFLRPGDRVDVYWTGSGDDETGGVTRLIHPNLPLIAIDQETNGEQNAPTIARTITVEASPEVVAKLAQAQATGRLALALVGVRDESESEAVQATLTQILGPREAPAPVEEAEVCSVRTRRGAEVVDMPIPCPAGG